MDTDILSAALRWNEAGCSVYPIRADGTKKPIGEWKANQSVRATTQEITAWYTRHPEWGISLICGAVSGGLEMLELEGRAMQTPEDIVAFQEALERFGVAETWQQIKAGYLEWTPSGGIHVFYRLDGEIEGNKKLAHMLSDEVTDKGNPIRLCMSETRGERGYVVVAPSGGKVHKTGEDWKTISGSPETIMRITWHEREQLHAAVAYAFDRIPEQVAPSHVPAGTHQLPYDGTERPGDQYAQQTSWSQILQPEGWTYSHSHAGTDYWVRPGKAKRDGHSATTREDGGFYAWSGDVEPYEKPLSKLFVYAYYHHRGDMSAAAAQLRRDGFGADRPMPSDFFEGYGEPQMAAERPPAPGLDGATPSPSKEPQRKLRLTAASKFAIKRVRWLWQDRAPIGEMTLIPGREGVGKSLMLANLASGITRGTLPGEFFGECRSVIYCASEDSWHHTIAPRLLAAGANMDMIFRLDVVIDDVPQGAPILPQDCAGLVHMGREVQAACLMLDPIVSMIDGKLDTYKAPELRQALEPLRRAAEKAGMGILALAHFNKSSGVDVSSRVAGSRAWMEVARAAISIAKLPYDEEDEESQEGFLAPRPNRCVVSQEKNNLGRLDLPHLVYQVDEVILAAEDGEASVGRVTWTGMSDISAGEAMESRKNQDGPNMEGIIAFVKEAHRKNQMLVATAELYAFFGDELSEVNIRKTLSRAVTKGRLESPVRGMYRPKTKADSAPVGVPT